MIDRRWVFLRHGQSTANAARVFSGHADVDLTELGRQQAIEAGAQLAQILGHTPIDQVLISSLRRAAETAEIALRAVQLADDATIVHTRDLWERTLGEWQGMGIDALKATGKRLALLEWNGRAPGGESLRDLALRVLPVLAKHDTAPTTLVVCHGGVIRVALGLADHTPFPELCRWNPQNATPILRHYPPGHWSNLSIPD